MTGLEVGPEGVRVSVYMVMEGGESSVFAALNWKGAIDAAWARVLRQLTDSNGEPLGEAEADLERRQWEASELESVTLVGELDNVDDLFLAYRNAKAAPGPGEAP